MKYHIRIELKDNTKECKIDLSEDDILDKYVRPYLNNENIMIKGRSSPISDIYRIKIVESNDSVQQRVGKIELQDKYNKRPFSIFKLSAEWRAIEELNEVTDRFLNSTVISNLSKSNTLIIPIKNKTDYVNKQRINELSNIKNTDYDFIKLIQLCKEINVAWQIGNYFTVIALVRTIMDHIAPIFGFKEFAQVASNYPGGSSFKKSMQNLLNSTKNIADSHLHGQIKKKDTLPNDTQVNYKNDLDFLLMEIVKLTK